MSNTLAALQLDHVLPDFRIENETKEVLFVLWLNSVVTYCLGALKPVHVNDHKSYKVLSNQHNVVVSEIMLLHA